MTKYNTELTEHKGYEQHGLIYCITNRINGIKYIGLTTKSVQERFEQHCKADSTVGRAIREFGRENMQVEILDYADTQDELCDLEMMWIDTFDTYNKGYNDTLGGEGIVRSRIKVDLTDKQRAYIDFLKSHYDEHDDAYNRQMMYERYVLSSIAWYYLSRYKSAKTKFAKLIMSFPNNEYKKLLELGLVDKDEFFMYANQ